ncbi:MAG: hypothetical protein NDI91_03610 [Sulfuritalea sp.]|nr:hypothetical protein [Sulfuritalea sp.]
MQNSVPRELVSPLVVAAHDAGAANLIIGWLRGRRALEVRACLSGPAAGLWTSAFGDAGTMSLPDAMRGAATLLSGTSYASTLEHQARGMAKEQGVYSIGVVDHWVNYPGRFVREGIQVLPDEIWVADEDAHAIAVASFPGVFIRQQPNLYLADLVSQVRAADTAPRQPGCRRVLYALEPIRHAWTEGGDAGEFQTLDYFIRHGELLGLDASAEIRLRPHPSDPAGKYDAWMARHAGWNLRLDPNASLAESLAWADTVVGCETYVLVVALASNRRVVSTLPPHAPRCRLPMKGIIHLRDIPALNFPSSAS